MYFNNQNCKVKLTTEVSGAFIDSVVNASFTIYMAKSGFCKKITLKTVALLF